jgi:hypothetical protein
MLRTLLFAATLASNVAFASDIQKCIDPDGGVIYQDSPCARGRTLATIPRAPAYADPEALRAAENDRLKLQQALEFRARLAMLDASREAIARGVAPRMDYAPPYDVAPIGPEGPYYYAVPSYGVRGSGHSAPRSRPSIAASPGILDTPAPCTTLQCQQHPARRR